MDRNDIRSRCAASEAARVGVSEVFDRNFFCVEGNPFTGKNEVSYSSKSLGEERGGGYRAM